MNHYEAVNILDMLNAIGEDAVKNILSDFSCPKNFEIESFVKQNALEFAKRKMSITYLVIDEEGQLAAIFALTHKAVQLTNEGLSGSMRKKIERHAKLDEQSNTYMLSAFLIAQFGKNAQYTEKITGNELMDMTMNILVAVQREIGGGVVYLECEERPQLLTFYENKQQRTSQTRSNQVCQLVKKTSVTSKVLFKNQRQPIVQARPSMHQSNYHPPPHHPPP